MPALSWFVATRRIAAAAAVVTALSAVGCAFAFPGTRSVTEDPASRHLRYIPIGDPPSPPLEPVPGDNVDIVILPRDKGSELVAEGLTLDGLSIRARADYPTAEAPHRVLGEVRLDFLKRDAAEDAAKVMAAEAGRHGANTLYIVDLDGSRWPGDSRRVDRRAVAVRLSNAAPPSP